MKREQNQSVTPNASTVDTLTVRQLTTDDIPACRKLWQARFFDSDAFMDWYFSDRFCPELSFGLFDHGSLCSMAHGRMMQLRFGGAVVSALMIGGVSTVETCEGRGYMRRVLDAIKQFAEKNAIPLLLLTTETPAIYKSSGFNICAGMLQTSANGGNSQPLSFDPMHIDLEALTTCCNAVGERYHFFPVRSTKSMLSRLHECFSTGAGLLTLYADDGSVEGYAVCDPQEKIAEEVLARTTDGYARLLAALAENTSVLLPPDVPFEGQPWKIHTMCLAIDEKQLPTDWQSGLCFCPETF